MERNIYFQSLALAILIFVGLLLRRLVVEALAGGAEGYLMYTRTVFVVGAFLGFAIAYMHLRNSRGKTAGDYMISIFTAVLFLSPLLYTFGIE